MAADLDPANATTRYCLGLACERQAFRTVQRMAKLAGIEGQISPQSLRHTFATIALDAGTTLHDLQDSMGHADPCTTLRYDRARHTLAKTAGYVVARALA